MLYVMMCQCFSYCLLWLCQSSVRTVRPFCCHGSCTSSLFLVPLVALCPLHTMACDASIIHVWLQQLHLNAPEVFHFFTTLGDVSCILSCVLSGFYSEENLVP